MAVLDAPTMPVVLADGRCRRATEADPGRVALRRFAVGTALALLIVGLAAMLLARRAAEREAEFDVRRATELLGVTIVENNLEDALLRGDLQARARLDQVVQQRLVPTTDLRLENDPRLAEFRAGDIVAVEGELIREPNAGEGQPWSQYPRYHVREIRLIERK